MTSSDGAPVISLLHATRGRPEQAIATRLAWLTAAKRPEIIEHLFAFDADDASSREALSVFAHGVVEATGGGCVAAWNLAAEKCRGDVLLQLSDDWEPLQDWDEILLSRLGDLHVPKVLKISDGHRHDDLLCMAICTRARYEQQGCFQHPDYTGLYSDDEFSFRAHQDGVVVNAVDVKFTHHHPDFDSSVARDETYRQQNSLLKHMKGRRTFLRRNPHALKHWFHHTTEDRHFVPLNAEANRQAGLPMISVIMRTCNRPELMGRALKSVAEQSYPNIELVVVTHGRGLEYAPLVVERELADRPLPVKRVSVAENDSLGAMLNAGVEQADGRWIIVLDDDDTWHYECLERLAAALLADVTPAPRGSVCQHLVIHERSEADGSITEIKRTNESPGLRTLLLSEHAGDNRVAIHAFLYEKQLWSELGGYDESLEVAEDWDFSLRCLMRTDLMVVNRPLAHYHWRPEATQQTQTSKSLQHAYHAARVINRFAREALGSREGLGSLALAGQLSHTIAKLRHEVSQVGQSMRQMDKTRKKLAECQKALKASEKKRLKLEKTVREWNARSWLHRVFHRLRIK